MSKPPTPPVTNSRREAVNGPVETFIDHIASLTDEMLVMLDDLCKVKRPLTPAEAKLERALARAVPREAKRRQNKSRAGVGSTRTANSAQTAS
jgi:hypothetical protein